jgi:hypothetical protein
MKLSAYEIAIEQAYNEVLFNIQINDERQQHAFNFIHRRPRHVLPRERPFSTPPRPVTEYESMEHFSPKSSKEKMVVLAAFEATYQDSITPMSPDMVPLIIDTGASISLSPHKSDFISPIRPVQNVTIKGIASGLTVKGVGDLSYTY